LPFWGLRGELYETFLTDAVTRWEERAAPKPTTEQRSLFLDFAAEVAYRLWQQDARRTFWDEVIVGRAVNMVRQRYNSLNARDDLLGDLCAAGLLSRAGPDERNTPLFFTHRSFGEYLAACALAQKVAEPESANSANALLEKLAWIPEREQVVLFLAGKVEDPGPLLTSLADASRDDVFRHRLALAGRCLGELARPLRERYQDHVDGITDTLFALWWRHQQQNTGAALPHVTRTLRVLGQVNGKCNDPVKER
jgi:hypothetical protein